MISRKIATFIVLIIMLFAIVFSIYIIFGKDIVFDYYYQKATETSDVSGKISNYDMAIKANPQNFSAINELVDILIDSEMYDEANEYITIAIENNADNYEIYLKQIKIFEIKGQIDTAISFANNIKSGYVNLKLASKTQNIPEINLPSGDYDEYIEIEFTVLESANIYYKLDNQGYMLYQNPITLLDGYHKLTAVSINDEGVVSKEVSRDYMVSSLVAPANFSSDTIIKKIENQLDLAGELDEQDLKSAISIDLSTEVLYNDDITSLINCRNLEELFLGDISNVDTLEPLEKIDTLKSITINSGCDEKMLAEILKFDSIESVKIINSTIYSIPENTSTIKSLIIKNSLLSDIQNIGTYKTLEYLDLSNNFIEKVDGIGNLQRLKYLALSDNNISKLDGIIGTISIEYINLSNNEIQDASAIATLLFLKEINISNNKLTSVLAFSKLRYLETLNCSFNSILTLEPLTQNSTIKTIYANDNIIVDVSYLDDFESVGYINIKNNNL